jgi:uncharacterized protein
MCKKRRWRKGLCGYKEAGGSWSAAWLSSIPDAAAAAELSSSRDRVGSGMDHLPLLLAAGFLAGTMNAVAGGGSFLTLPALVLAGLPSVVANASSTVALFPGSLASIWVYRDGIARVDGVLPGVSIWPLLATSLVGGLAGAVLLLATPSTTFDRVIPWLLLLATLALAFGPRIGLALRRVVRIGAPALLAVQFLLGIYGGYFGGAVGIMMMAAWSLLGSADLKAMNPVKTLLVAATNAVAVLCFAAAGAVRWPETIAVLLAALAGGYAGAHAGRRLSPRLIRAAVVAITAAMTAAFFIRAWG